MDAARWKKIDDLLDEALSVPIEQRKALVTLRSGSDIDLQTQVLKLLEAETRENSFLEGSALQAAAHIAKSEFGRTDEDLTGKVISTYTIKELLGAGGMGKVYLAYDEKLARNVALKILPSHFSSGDLRIHRFETEAQAIARLNHPGIITVYDVGSSDGVNYICTEFVEGDTLRNLMGKNIPVNEIILTSIKVCDALEAAHKNGIVHRDIKPENIMIRNDGYPKLLDFGIAILSDTEDHALSPKSSFDDGILGTPAYMSPAQIKGEQLDHRTDLWSCGVILYEFLTGIHPFRCSDNNETFQAILEKEPSSCRSINPNIPVELENVITKLLQKDPAMTYVSAAELRRDLKKIISASPYPVRSDGNVVASEINNSKISSVSIFAGVSISAAILVTAAYFLWFFRSDDNSPDWSAAKSVQLTFNAGEEIFPSLAPDGSAYAFAAREGDNTDIFLQRIGGGHSENLTSDSPADDSMPAISPDGSLIAFRSDRAPAGIYLMDMSGKSVRQIADFGYSPAWSPDGKQLAVATAFRSVPSTQPISSIWIIDIESGEKRLLVEDSALQPSWSPDGTRIAYWFTGLSGNRIVATIPAKGGSPEIFADTSNTNWNPVWSPDGKYLYYASDLNGNMAFWRAKIDIATGRPVGEHQPIPTSAKFSRHLAFSADGNKMAYVQTDQRSNIKKAAFDLDKEQIIGDISSVTNGDFEFSAPEITPDGNSFIARLIRDIQEDIVEVDAKTGAIRDLTNDKAFDRYVRVSPDGRYILFSSDRSGTYQIWMMELAACSVMQITFFEDSIGSIPSWSSDGQKISFDDQKTTYIMNLNGPRDIDSLLKLPLTDNGGFFRAWDWSPDGKKLAGNFDTAHGPGVGFYSFDTQKYERLTDDVAIPRWLPDGRRMIFERNGRPVIAETDTRRVREILPAIKDHIRNIAVSRDGKTIYYTTRESESNIWMLDLNDDSEK